MTAFAVRRTRSFVDPRSLVFLVFSALVAYGLVRVSPLVLGRMAAYPGPGLLAALVWAFYAAVLLVILYRMELFERRSSLTIAGAFVWGAVVVTGIGVTASPAMAGIVASWLGEDMADWVPAISAPLVEEPLKMLGVIALALIPGARINSPLDGLFYGLIAGLGFEVVESLLYTTDAVVSQGGAYSAVFSMLLLRGVIGGLWSHPTFSGISGAGVGYYFGSDRSLIWRLLVAAGSLLAAMLFHGLFNSPLFTLNPVLGAVLRGIPVLVVLLIVLRMARDDERSRFQHAAVGQIDPSLLNARDRESLMRKSTRRAAVQETTETAGVAAGIALAELQQAQVDMVEEAIYEGVGSASFEDAARRVRTSKESLADLT